MATVIDRPESSVPPKGEELFDRFREIISDPLNLLIERVPMAGIVADDKITLHNGLRVPTGVYYGDFTSIIAINRGVHEPLEEYVFQEVLRQLDPTQPIEMIELGSYWAHYSMWLKSRFPQARTTCVEPDYDNLEAGRANFALNGMSGAFIQAMVADKKFQIDAFLAKEPRAIDILHADIQGYEIEMLIGSAKSLADRKIRRVFISTHSQELHENVIEFLKKFGYRIDISSDYAEETTSCDGLIYASLPDLPPLLAGVEIMGRTAICQARPHDIVAYLGRVLAA
ncbi:MAG: FkbM family methyltransferase [Geminicoccaceae bacterium]